MIPIDVKATKKKRRDIKREKQKTEEEEREIDKLKEI